MSPIPAVTPVIRTPTSNAPLFRKEMAAKQIADTIVREPRIVVFMNRRLHLYDLLVKRFLLTLHGAFDGDHKGITFRGVFLFFLSVHLALAFAATLVALALTTPILLVFTLSLTLMFGHSDGLSTQLQWHELTTHDNKHTTQLEWFSVAILWYFKTFRDWDVH
jgi:hypothetical protein